MFGQKSSDASQPDQQNYSQDNGSTDGSWQHPGAPVASASDSTTATAPAVSGTDLSSTDASSTSDTSPELSNPFITAPISKTESSNEVKPAPKDSKDDLLDNSHTDLLEIKQKALNELSPLMSHLDQTPEEKFRTLMMMLQASDDQKLVKEVYEAAQNIKDDKVRAQALLDIVNEINYFTQQSNS